MSSKVNQKEYLKKYLSGEKKKHKSKRKTRDASRESSRVKIIDDDLDTRKKNYDDDDTDLILTGEDAPQIVGIVDERPSDLKTYEDFRTSGKWKSLSSNNHNASSHSHDQERKTTHRRSRERQRDDYRKSTETPPPRRNRSQDLSPVRRRRHGSEESVTRYERNTSNRKREFNSNRSDRRENASCEKKSKPYENKSDDDLSPVRKRSPCKHADKHISRDGGSKRGYKDSFDDRHDTKSKSTLDGKKAGLQSARMLREENDKIRKREDEMFKKMPEDVSGKNAEAVVRNMGRRAQFEEDLKREEEKAKREMERKRVYSRWGKGLKQIEAYENKVMDEIHEMSKPLARYSDDADLDKMLKSQERIGDPMLNYIRRKQDEKNKQENVQSTPIYQGQFPENRFNIRPGYRWDGIDRSNGYEIKWFDEQSRRKAVQEEAYKYSTEDM